jgi:hypothetical protein
MRYFRESHRKYTGVQGSKPCENTIVYIAIDMPDLWYYEHSNMAGGCSEASVEFRYANGSLGSVTFRADRMTEEQIIANGRKLLEVMKGFALE